jgi:NitT/TauT family transport system substrate-binding protein
MTRTTSTRRVAASAAAAVTAALVLAACGGGDDDSSAGGGEDGELTPVTVGLIPIIDVAPVYLGIEQGIFEEHGLDVTPESGQGGAAIVPSVISGDFQFGFGNSMSTVIGASTGIDLRVIASGNWSSGDRDNDGYTIMSADDSITELTDLEGMTVATNTVNAIGDSVVREAVELAGGDPDSIEFVEMPFPDMPAAMDSGQVDAAWIVEPFVTMSLDLGAHIVSPVLLDIADEWEISTYFTSGTYAEANPEVVDAFRSAINESATYAQEHPDEVRAILDEYLELPEGLADRVILPAWHPGVSRDTFDIYYRMAEERDLLQGDVDLDLLLSYADTGESSSEAASA